MTGRLVENQSRDPIAGASLQFQQATEETVTTDANGNFSASSFVDGLIQLTISAPGYLTHRTNVRIAGSRDGVTVDAIANAAPFSLDFYRQFVRNGFEAPPGIAVTHPWTMAPSFYVRTVTDDTGDSISPGVLDAVRRVVVGSVFELTGGHFQVASYETGTDPRAPQTGWVTINFFHTFPTADDAGDSLVGGNPGRIRLQYDPSLDVEHLYNPEQCESLTVGTIDHEIVHAMGFYHTDDTYHDFQSGPGCPGAGRPERVRYHAAVMYSRPYGNTDIDNDPPNFSAPLRVGAAPATVISCPL